LVFADTKNKKIDIHEEEREDGGSGGKDNPLLRDSWFMRGRQSPDGLSAAAHRYQAFLQAQSLPVITGPFPSSGSSLNTSPSLSAPLAISGACDWSELGPAPLANSLNANRQNV